MPKMYECTVIAINGDK